MTITPWNDPPVANEQNLVTDENVNLSITVSGSDVDGDNLTYVLFTLPINGILKQGDVTIAAPIFQKPYHPTISLTYPMQATMDRILLNLKSEI